jgi:hypothetical protein
MDREQVQMLNQSELEHLKDLVNQEVGRRAAGPKVITYYAGTCITETYNFIDFNAAMRCVQALARDMQEYANEEPSNLAYINKCTGVAGVKFRVVEMTEADYLARKAAHYFSDELWPEKPDA